jgi:histidine ammonia-lyase
LYLRRIKKNIKKESNMTHDQIVAAYETYLAENENFETKNVKAAAARARKALGELGKLTKTRRAEIQEKKLSL